MVYQRHQSTAADATILATPLRFKNGKIAKNRFMKAAMTERISTWNPVDLTKRGIPSERIINLYEKWGNGGFGLILTGNIPVDPFHLEFAGNTVVSKENDTPELRKQLKRYAQIAKQDGALVVAQLTNAGRQTPFAVNPTPFSASDVQLLKEKEFSGYGKPIPLTLEQIKTEVIDRFVYEAKIIYESGFDGVQLHGAHGYLLSQFMSPTTNKRTDQYGGPPENRVRIVLEIYDAIRQAIPANTGFLVGIKMNSVEFQDQGLNTNDAKIMCKLLDEKGFDFVEMSGGTMEKWAFHHQRDSTKKREAFFLEFTDMIRPVFKNTVVYVTGGFRTVGGMVSAVINGSTDGIGLGRPAAAEPDLPKKILKREVDAAPSDLLDQNNLGLTLIGATSQMALAGKHSLAQLNGMITADIPDFSQPEEAAHFLSAVAAYSETVEQLAKKNIPISGVLEYSALCNYN